MANMLVPPPPPPNYVPVTLPSIVGLTAPMLEMLTKALGVDRSILAADEQIEHAWSNLPRLLSKIPPELRSETLVRMCVAVGAGLFDSAINYSWNAAIIELRDKVRRFGLAVVPQIIGKQFDEKNLLDLTDAQLLDLCLQLNLISEEGHFLLHQCRDVRNNFSAAHPSMGALDESEFLAFLNRCAKHALANERNPRGVDIQAFIGAVKVAKFTIDQLDTWCGRLGETFEAQRDTLIGTLHGIYCDPVSGEEARVNCLSICEKIKATFSPKVKSELIDRHEDYCAKGDEPRHKASLQYFEKLGLLAALGSAELHAIITSASANLLAVHSAFNNFYNEPPFAERLGGLTLQNPVPETALYAYVNAVITAGVGNQYGVSHAAMPYYEKMVRSFSPLAIRMMFDLVEANTTIGNRVKAYYQCKDRYAYLVSLLDKSSVPTSAKKSYDKWIVVAATMGLRTS